MGFSVSEVWTWNTTRGNTHSFCASMITRVEFSTVALEGLTPTSSRKDFADIFAVRGCWFRVQEQLEIGMYKVSGGRGIMSICAEYFL